MIHMILRREALVINHKRTARIYRQNRMQLTYRNIKRRLRGKSRQVATAEAINQRWSMDFMHDTLADGRAFRILTMIDEYSRESLCLEVDLSLSAQRVVRVLERLKSERGLPLEIGIDQGPEFTSLALHRWAKDHGVNLHFAAPGDKNENAFIESFNARLRDSCLNLHWFTSLAEAQEEIGKWRLDYNYERPHGSLGGLTPVAFAKQTEVTKCA